MSPASLTCPWCGETAPNELLLSQSHWVKWGPLREWEYDWCREHDMCIGQELVLNHLAYDLRHHADLDTLRRDLARAEAKWAVRDDKPPILAEARQAVEARERAEQAPEHASITESEAVALW